MLCLAACSKDYTYRIEGKLSHLTEPTVYAVFENEQEKKVDTLLCADNGTFELEEQMEGFHSVTLFFEGINYSLMKQLSQYSVTIHERDFHKLLSYGAIEKVIESIYVVNDRAQYDENIGLRLDNHWMNEILMA